jgi:hypothetical protein
MNEQQASFTRKLKVDQNCSYPMIARKFHGEFGNTKYCNEKNAQAVMYFDLDNASKGTQVHKFENGPLKVSNYRLVEYLFSPEVGQQLCLIACSVLNEEAGDGWLDFAMYGDYERTD